MEIVLPIGLALVWLMLVWLCAYLLNRHDRTVEKLSQINADLIDLLLTRGSVKPLRVKSALNKEKAADSDSPVDGDLESLEHVLVPRRQSKIDVLMAEAMRREEERDRG